MDEVVHPSPLQRNGPVTALGLHPILAPKPTAAIVCLASFGSPAAGIVSHCETKITMRLFADLPAHKTVPENGRQAI
jgi:hypothetical protein